MSEIDDDGHGIRVVCMRDPDESGATDNEHGKCSFCDHDIHFRPHMPKGPNVKYVCNACFGTKVIPAQGEKQVITDKVAQEMREWIYRRYGRRLPLAEVKRKLADLVAAKVQQITAERGH